MLIYRQPGLVLSVCFLLLASACGDDDGGRQPDPDAGSDAAIPIDGSDPCTDNGQCDDGIFCNGTEFCADTQCRRGVPIDCNDRIDCTTDICSDSTSSCRYFAPDVDNDDHPDVLCMNKDGDSIGDDCDDENANRYPGNIEVCDALNVDEDCDTATIGDKDQDQDGAIDNTCCNRDATNTLVCGTDCDDLKLSVNPTATDRPTKWVACRCIPTRTSMGTVRRAPLRSRCAPVQRVTPRTRMTVTIPTLRCIALKWRSATPRTTTAT
jgi:hypothetical protein